MNVLVCNPVCTYLFKKLKKVIYVPLLFIMRYSGNYSILKYLGILKIYFPIEIH